MSRITWFLSISRMFNVTFLMTIKIVDFEAFKNKYIFDETKTQGFFDNLKFLYIMAFYYAGATCASTGFLASFGLFCSGNNSAKFLLPCFTTLIFIWALFSDIWAPLTVFLNLKPLNVDNFFFPPLLGAWDILRVLFLMRKQPRKSLWALGFSQNPANRRPQF